MKTGSKLCIYTLHVDTQPPSHNVVRYFTYVSLNVKKKKGMVDTIRYFQELTPDPCRDPGCRVWVIVIACMVGR